MGIIPVDGHGYPDPIREELLKLAAEYPGRDFWQVPTYVGPDAWSSRPCGQSGADIIRRSPDAMRAAIEEARNG